jgi:uncharacterized protein (TIGR03437 family)
MKQFCHLSYSETNLMRILARNFPAVFLIFSAALIAAPPARLDRTIDATRTRVLTGSASRFAQGQTDLGPADSSLVMKEITLFFKPSGPQQAELDQLLADQQNPSAANFRKWLTPEEFADRFGLNNSDISKVSAWLTMQGLEVKTIGRGHNWISFNGSADKVGRALHTSIHRYRAAGADHYANAGDVSVPEALADVAAGFIGLDDFHPHSALRGFQTLGPDYTAGTGRHYLAPQDFSTIYDLAPLTQAGYDGTGQGIAVVGQSAILISDIRAFRTRFGLPANDPKILTYAEDPGITGDQLEGNLDIEWAGALAPRATIYYVYGSDAFNAAIAAISANLAPVISISYTNCEINIGVAAARGIFQQANAQGITVVNSSGDAGAAGCDIQDFEPFASRGRYVNFPSDIPEVTGVGGTQFNEGAGTYWSTTNSTVLGSALSYIPEIAWNESDQLGLGSSGGGASAFIGKPAWQSGPGVPNDNARDVPDISLSAAGHDAYLIYYQGSLGAVAGTSASAPSFAGMLALLNQYQVKQGFLKSPGLGNINPQLYRLAQSSPAVFHDIVGGGNVVTCLQGSPDCQTGSFGYNAGPGYDLSTGLGSLDGNAFVTQWNQSAAPVTVTLNASPGTVTINDYVALYATADGGAAGTPTGAVAFSANGVPLETVPLSGNPLSASLLFPAYRLAAGNDTIAATYSGDAAFSSSAATARVRVNLPAKGTSGVTLSVPSVAFANPPDALGLSWQFAVTLKESNGSPAILTGFTIEGLAQPLAPTFSAPSIPANATLIGSLIVRNAQPGATRTLGFTGTDATGVVWTRQATVTLLPVPGYLGGNVTASPLQIQQNMSASPACQWKTQLTIDNLFGYRLYLQGLSVDNIDRAGDVTRIFGTDRIEAWGSISGTLCFGGITPPAYSVITVPFGDEFGDTFHQDVTVTFAGPPASAATMVAAPASVSLSAPLTVAIPPSQQVTVTMSDKNQQWSAAVYPGNRLTSWLKLSQYSGTGNGTITLQARGSGLTPGAYRATVIITSANTVPQAISIPVMFVNGAAAGTTITGAGNAFSFTPTAAPGMVMAIYGSGLAGTTTSASSQPLPYSLSNVTAAVNGVPAPLYFVSPGQLNVQVPYWVGAGPAVVGVNNNGVIAGYQINITPTAPGILTNGSGSVSPSASGSPGSVATLYVTGDGEVNDTTLESGFAPAAGTALANLPRPVQAPSVTVGGVQAVVQFYGLTPGIVGMSQVNFIVPAVNSGAQPVVVTVGGVSSAPATITITGATSK